MELTTREACCEGNAIRESVHTLACLMRPRYAARARTQGEPDPRPTAEEAPDA